MAEKLKSLILSPDQLDINELFTLFNYTDSELKESIKKAGDRESTNLIKAQVSNVSNLIQTCVGQLSAYDQKRYSDQISTLFKLIQEKESGFKEKKFSFKSRGKINSETNKKLCESTSISPASSTDVEPDVPLIKGITKKKITIDHFNKHAHIENVFSSIISTNMSAAPGSVHLKNSRDSIIHLISSGPVFIHDTANVILVVKCHQLRLHNVHNSKILIQVSNNKAIIENCDKLLVGKYPFGNTQSNDVDIDDFNWPTKLKRNVHFEYFENESNYDWINNMSEGELSITAKSKLESTLAL